MIRASEAGMIWAITLIISGLHCAYFIQKTCINAHRLMKERATQLELIAIGIISLSFIFYFFSGQIFTLLRDYVSIAGQTLLVINYMINKDYIFRLTFPVHDIYLINRAGILVYHRHVSTRNIPDLDPSKQAAISGAIKAISIIVKETLGSGANLKFFDAEEYKMYFSELKEKSGIVIVITSGNNYYLQKSITIFSNSFSDALIQGINQSLTNKGELSKILDDHLREAFPYLILL